MERDYDKELDALREEMAAIRQLLAAMAAPAAPPAAPGAADPEPPFRKVHVMRQMHPDPRIAGVMETLCRATEERDITGAVTWLGVFTSGGRQSNWIRHTVDADSLLANIENRTAAAVLGCIGNNDRLNLLLALLRQPQSVAALVESGLFRSTGQVYHHLKPLIAADIVQEVEQGERGVYAVKPHRVQGVIMLLAGIFDLTDDRHSSGTYEPEGEPEN